MLPLTFRFARHDIQRMRLFLLQRALCVLFVAAVLMMPLVARADECNSSDAQLLARQGYAFLDQQRWTDARQSAGQLALYAKNCSDPKVGFPSVVHSAYIGAVALHGLGQDAKASQAAQMGMTVLDMLHKEGGYEDLYNALAPKFSVLESQLKT